MSVPIVLYRGPSALDGAPIVAIASIGSTNVKTGPMVQTWIMRADVNPLQASADASDSSVCGQCPRRHSLGGDCYVTLIQAPRAVWAGWDKAGRPGPNWVEPNNLERLTKAAQANGFRLGSYGDPAAVPWYVWGAVMDAIQPKLWTGYTHQWRTLHSRMSEPGLYTHDYNQRGETLGWMREHVMASCDSSADAAVARSLGWRFFLATGPGVEVPERTVLCLAEREGDKARTCETCGICDGARNKPTRASVYLVEHGARSTAKHKRIAALKVVQ